MKALWERAFHLTNGPQETATKLGEIEAFRQVFAGAKVSFSDDMVTVAKRDRDDEMPLMLCGTLERMAPVLRALKFKLEAKSCDNQSADACA